MKSRVGASTNFMTPEDYERERRMADAEYKYGMQLNQAPRHWTQALAGALSMGLSGYREGQARKSEAEAKSAGNEALAAYLRGDAGALDSAMSNPYVAQQAFQLKLQEPQRQRAEAEAARAAELFPLQKQKILEDIAAKRRAAANQEAIRGMVAPFIGGEQPTTSQAQPEVVPNVAPEGATPAPGPMTQPGTLRPSGTAATSRFDFGVRADPKMVARSEMKGTTTKSGEFIPDMGPEAPDVSQQQRAGIGIGLLGDPKVGKMVSDIGSEDRKLRVKEARDALSAGSKEAQSARNQINQLKVLERGLELYNKGAKLGSGVLAPFEVAARGYLQSLGMNPNDPALTGANLVSAVQNQLALMIRNPDSGMGLPGATSDRDIKFLLAMNPGLTQSEGGNAAMIEVGRRMLQRKIRVQELRNQYYKTRKSLDGFDEYLSQYAKANPLFDDLRSNPVFGAGQEGSAASSDGRFTYMGSE